MSDIHIDDFYRDSAKILLQLHGCFPRKANVYVEDISGPDTPDEFGLHSDRHQACFSAILWLAESGYIQYLDTVQQEAVDQASLTHKAFTLLASLADGEDPQQMHCQTNIARLRDTLKHGSSTSLSRLMHQLLMQSRQH